MAIPDAVALVRTYLDGLHSEPVVTRVPNPRPATFIRVRRVGGAALPPVRDVARLDVQCWAPTEPEAATLGALVRKEMLALRGTTVGGVECYRVEETLYRQADDPETGTPQTWATYALTLRAEDVLPE